MLPSSSGWCVSRASGICLRCQRDSEDYLKVELLQRPTELTGPRPTWESRTAPDKPASVAFLPYISISKQAVVQAQHPVSRPTPEVPLRMRSSVRRTDRPFHRDQGQGAPAPDPSGATRKIRRGRTLHQLGYRIKLQDTTNLCTKPRYRDRMVREAIEI
jgi:hypothetical protein